MPFQNHDQLITDCQTQLARISLCKDPDFIVNQSWRNFIVAYAQSKALASSAPNIENTEAMRLHLNNIITFCKDQVDADYKTIYEIIVRFCDKAGISVVTDVARIRMR